MEKRISCLSSEFRKKQNIRIVQQTLSKNTVSHEFKSTWTIFHCDIFKWNLFRLLLSLFYSAFHLSYSLQPRKLFFAHSIIRYIYFGKNFFFLLIFMSCTNKKSFPSFCWVNQSSPHHNINPAWWKFMNFPTIWITYFYVWRKMLTAVFSFSLFFPMHRNRPILWIIFDRWKSPINEDKITNMMDANKNRHAKVFPFKSELRFVYRTQSDLYFMNNRNHVIKFNTRQQTLTFALLVFTFRAHAIVFKLVEFVYFFLPFTGERKNGSSKRIREM